MKVSAIVPVRNGEKFIKENLESLLSQTRKPDEIIVVNDGSEDSTKSIVEKMPVHLISLSENVGRSKARNIGFEKASGDVIFFVEADAKYNVDFLEKCTPELEGNNVGGVIGKQGVWNKNDSAWTKCKSAEREANFEDYKPFSAWIYKRSALEKSIENGTLFDEKLDFGEDVDLANRVKKEGYSLKYVPSALWFHQEPSSIIPILKRSWKFGLGMNRFYKKHGYPKTTILDLGFFVSIIASFFFLIIGFLPFLYLIVKLYTARMSFYFVEKKYWGHMAFFQIVPSLVFKLARILGAVFS